MPDTRYLDAIETDREQILQIYESELGCDRDSTNTWISDALHYPERPVHLTVAERDRTVIGFGLVAVLDSDWVSDFIHYETPGFDLWDRTAVFLVSAVRGQHQGHGHGTKLFSKRLEYVKEDTDAEGAVGLAWHRPNDPDARGLFERFGFESRQTWEPFFSKFGDHRKRKCIVCGDSCTCPVTLYTHPLDG